MKTGDKEIDLIIKSEPWTEKDLADFRELMKKIKRRNKVRKSAKPAPIEKAV